MQTKVKFYLLLSVLFIGVNAVAQKSLPGTDKNSPFAITYESLKLYPNPVVTTAKLDFTLKETAKVQVTLLNILGGQIKSIINESRIAGNQSLQFSADQLVRGTYFLRLSINGEIIKTIRVAIAPQ